jgi:mRNA interferase MazF
MLILAALYIKIDSMKVIQGAVFWLKIESKTKHPFVVIQNVEDVCNNEIKTTIVCAITTNKKKLNMPGNVVLEIGEGNLEKESIVEVMKVYEVDKSQLIDYIGTLSAQRVTEIRKGIEFLDKTYSLSVRK